jgi:hypothetical protein
LAGNRSFLILASGQYRAMRHGIDGNFGNFGNEESATCKLYNPANGSNPTLTAVPPEQSVLTVPNS